MKTDTRRMVESALLLTIGTVLSVLSFQGVWALGGSITFCSMLPLVVLSWRWGWKWGTLCSVYCRCVWAMPTCSMLPA